MTSPSAWKGVCGRDEEASQRGRASLAASLSGQVARGRLDPVAEAAVLAKVEAAGIDSGLQDCDLVIESAPEDRAVKNALLATIEKAAPKTILASTTSGLAIGGLAQALADPSRFRALRADEWALFDCVSPSGAFGRGLTIARVYSRAGGLVASVTQECLLSPNA